MSQEKDLVQLVDELHLTLESHFRIARDVALQLDIVLELIDHRGAVLLDLNF